MRVVVGMAGTQRRRKKERLAMCHRRYRGPSEDSWRKKN